jgi:ribulose bisphosphate carboxylase small subunit
MVWSKSNFFEIEPMSRSSTKHIVSAGLSSKIRFVKSAGWDWTVYYRSGGDPETLAMSVFGQMRPEDALSEAHHPKVESYGDYLYVILHGIDFKAREHCFRTRDVDFFVGAEEIADAVAAKGKNARLVRVLSATEVNGLEFDHVVVVEPAAIVGDDRAGLGSLYVALTRSTQTLSVIHARPLPAELVGADREPGTTVEAGRASTAQPSEAAARQGEAEPERGGPGPNQDRGAVSDAAGLRALVRRGVEQERRSGVRQGLWCALMLELHGRGHAPEYDGLADALCAGPDGNRLFHVLGEDGPTYEGMRQGALRAKEVAHVHGTEADTVCLVLPNAPEQVGAVEAVREMFGILVIWRVQRSWAGPDAFRIFG